MEEGFGAVTATGADGGDAAAAAHARERAALRIFISYRRHDSGNAVDLICERLVRSGFRRENIFRDIEIKPGRNWVEEIERSLGNCDVVLAVVGPQWVTAANEADDRRLDEARDWVRRELELALKGEADLLPVLVGGTRMPNPDTLPPSLAPFTELMSTDITSERLDHDVERLIETLDDIAHRIASRRVENLRERNLDFTGRESVLAEIEAALARDGRPAVVTIIGFPGFGKTQVAVEYAHRHRDDYRILCEIPAERATTRVEHFAALARELRLPVRDGCDVVALVVQELERADDWLLIFDNANPDDDLRPALPRRGNGHVIVTSQQHRTDLVHATTIQIDVLPEDEATEFVTARLPAHDSAGARELARELQGYPLALEQAVAYIRNNQTSPLNYIRILREHWADALGTGAPPTYDNTVMGTWRLVFADVSHRAEQEGNVGALALLNLCAFLDPDGIRLDVLAEHADELPDALAKLLRGGTFARTSAVGLLARYSHVRWTADNEAVTMHRTVQRLARERLPDEDKAEWAETAVRVVLAAFPADPDDVRRRQACSAVLPHAIAALEHGREFGTDPVARARLLDRVGVYLESRAEFGAAKDALTDAFNLFVQACGFEAAETATTENHLAGLFRELGDYDTARGHHAAAVRAHLNTCGNETPEVGRDLADLARTLSDSGDFASATTEYEQALRIFGTATESTYRVVADCHSGLFAALLRMGNIAAARDHLDRAVAVYDEFDPAHPEATFFRFVHDRLFGPELGAVPADRLQDVIDLAAEAYGEDHPEVAGWTRWLADDLLSRRELDAAAEAYERALAIDRAAYGDSHVKVARDLFSAFAVLAARGATDEAREALGSAIGIFDAANVPDIAFSRFDEALDSLGVIPAAVDEMHRVAEITFDVCGDASSLTASALAHLAAEMLEAAALDAAHEIAIAALDRMFKHFGANDARVARCYALLGSILFRGNDIEGARTSYEHALKIFDDADQPNQFDLMKVLTGLYPVLAVYDEARVAAIPPVAPPDGNDLEAASGRAASIRRDAAAAAEPEAPAVLERALVVAEETAAIGPLVDLCDAVLDPAGRFDDEEQILERVLRMATEAYGHEHVIPAAILGRLSGVAVARGRLDRARDLLDRALAIDDRPDIWRSALNAADGLRARGKLGQAREWQARVLAAAEQRYGPDHLVVADALVALGGVELEAGNTEDARRHFERTVAIHLREHGPDHPTLAVDHAIYLSQAHAALGDVKAAGDQLEEGLAIYARSAEVEHEVVKIRAERWLALGDAAVARGDLDAAAKYYENGRAAVGAAASPALVAPFPARLGAIAAVSGRPDDAIDQFETSARLWGDAGNDDPFWAVVRMCAPAVRPESDRQSLEKALRILREEVGLDVKTFRPKIRGSAPANWFEKESMTFLAPDGRANVIASSEPLDETIDTQRYAEIQGDLLKDEFSGYQEFSFEETELYGGRRGYVRHFEWAPPDGVPVTQIQAYYVEDGRGYTATATTPSSNFPMVELELRQILSGLKLVS